MIIICLEEEAFYALLKEVLRRLKPIQDEKDKWISGPEAMKLLRIKSKSTLQKFRDEGKIRFSQPEKRIILYDSGSIEEFLACSARETF